jgi:hypothetical protein
MAADADVYPVSMVGFPRRRLESFNYLTLAQCTNLVVNNLKDANHLLTPVVRRIRIRHEVTSTIANKNGPIPLPGRLDTEIVIHSTIGESQLISEFRAHQIVPRIGQPLFLAKINRAGRQDRWES